MSDEHGHGHDDQDKPVQLEARQVSWPGGSRLMIAGIVMAVGGIGGTLATAMGDKHRLAFSYLVAFLYWLSLSLGALFFVLVQHAARAGWSVVVRRYAELCTRALPIFALLFVPIFLWRHELFHWTHAAEVAKDEVLRHKAPYLNETFFVIRACIYFVVWVLVSRYYFKRSIEQDQTGDAALTRRMQVRSGPSLLGYGFTVTFAAFDWIMSLEPHWFSTIFGAYFFAGSLVAMFATMAIFTIALRRTGFGGVVTTEHFHDIGKLLFAFVVFWAYLGFSQYMLIWYANLPEETIWFRQRWGGGWENLSVLLGVGHFVVPFFFLLPRTVKRAQAPLFFGACWMLVMHFVDLYWLVMPTLQKGRLQFAPVDFLLWLGLGGVWIAWLGYSMSRNPLVPLKDPRLRESVRFENF